MFSSRGIERLAGALLVASFAAFLGHLVVLVTLRALSPTILLVLAYGFLILLSAVALYLAFRPHEEALALFSASGVAAHGLLVVLACAMILAHTGIAQKFSATAETEAVVVPLAALELTMNNIRLCAFAFLGLGFFPLGALIVRGAALARWVGWLGMAGGVLGFLGSSAGLFEAFGAGNATMLASIVPLFGFMLVLGIRLLVRETRASVAAPGRPARTSTSQAEEPGLIGTDYFVRQGPIPAEQIVAVLNIDGATLMQHPVIDVSVMGAANSTLREAAVYAGDKSDLVVIPADLPLLGSDHFPFARAGIPALWAIAGKRTGDPEMDGASLQRRWMKTRYHTPQDDMKQPLDFEAAAKLADFNFEAGRWVAESPSRPSWDATSAVGRFVESLSAKQ